ncbi:class I SAM-dependent rRNA methyltransferase [Chlorobium sp. BLA1]|uniref:class I SAM-dependent rRNA methyltransferase n=1 Tax=Candidatus Chlorobium masyuteum TaxID=2716876 RepID=UPI0014236819|nr:class I SAM-dependent rRNA methyltransferase [Candidatus Chlorobium masyuteum]NHQ60522.1 class I SAM-dependent rRNA methyltransferase [Candidatus Chlorobium masyuteum]
MHALYLKPKEHHRIQKGHLWVFSNELANVPRDIAAGETVQLFTHDKKFMGTGFYNPHSLIAFRLLTRKDEQPDKDFFLKRFLEALKLREKTYSPEETNAYRLVHGESDGLPGLIVDRFNQAIVLQAFSAGMDVHLPLITEVLQELFKPEVIVVRNESILRELEGIPLYKDVVMGNRKATKQTIYDAGISYDVDVFEGQKTGFFLDQRENRRVIRKFAKDAEVLDVFTNDGGFALNALYGGAKSAILVDASQEALQRAEHNAKLNNFSEYSLVAADAFDMLEQMGDAKESFDLVILDPPSFTKSRKNLPGALKGYKRLNKLGMQLVKNGGFLATASCSHHVSEEDFLQTVHQAALAAGCQLRLIYKNSQPFDHPVLLSMPETSYLKFACFYLTR